MNRPVIRVQLLLLVLMTEFSYSLIEHTFIPGYAAPRAATAEDAAAYLFAFKGYRILLQEEGDTVSIPSLSVVAASGLPVAHPHFLGTLDGQACYAVQFPEDVDAPAGMAFHGLRSVLDLLDEDFFWLAGRAVQIVEWDRTHRYCGRCGELTQDDAHERVKVCPACDLRSYPRLSPAIIVAVTRGDELLLARSHRHPPGRFSVLAGFVEPGETLEACVAREIKEEVGLDVRNIRYFGSQPWPFPHSLMIAFTCEYAGGEIVLEEAEMAEADWYTVDNLPRIPPPPTISRRLIEWFKASQGDENRPDAASF